MHRGRALLFLLPSELGYLRHLKRARIPLNEYEFPAKRIAAVQNQLEELVRSNYYLHKSAREAYRSWYGFIVICHLLPVEPESTKSR